MLTDSILRPAVLCSRRVWLVPPGAFSKCKAKIDPNHGVIPWIRRRPQTPQTSGSFGANDQAHPKVYNTVVISQVSIYGWSTKVSPKRRTNTGGFGMTKKGSTQTASTITNARHVFGRRFATKNRPHSSCAIPTLDRHRHFFYYLTLCFAQIRIDYSPASAPSSGFAGGIKQNHTQNRR